MVARVISRIVKFLIFGLIFFTLFTFVVKGLWNWLMPSLFGLHVITFWQALGILVLSKILFGGFRGGPHRNWNWRRRMAERWEAMTPEEREKFRERMRTRCGSFGAAESPEAKPIG
jgi:Ca2+/H+ antiporter, TMEM165/GDT1 family